MEQKRTRALALRDEGARHSFRLTLPRDVLRIAEEEMPAIEDEMEDGSVALPKNIWQNEDVHLFFFSFAAFFTAFYLFIF